MTEKRLFLLDAYALIFRAYYALIKMPRITQSGFNTSAIFGFVNTLEELLRKEKPTHLAVCFDPSGPTFRSEAYEAYKAERDAMPEDIRQSVPIIKEIIKAYRIPILEVEGFEADDVIGTMARKAEKESFTTYMMTPDKDFGQLVSPTVLQYKPSYRGQDFELRGEEEVCARYGLKRTSQVIDLLALMGDKIDNIPGCPGIGEKTAVKLLQDFGDIDNLLANTDRLKGALKKKIEENRDQILESRFLATIRTDVPIDTTPDELKRQPADREKLFAIFREFEFKTLTERVERRLAAESGTENPQGIKVSGAPEKKANLFSLFDAEEEEEVADEAALPQPVQAWDSASGGKEYRIAEDTRTLQQMQEALFEAKECGLYLATDGENDMEARWIGTAVALADGRGWYVPSDYADGQAMILDMMARPDLCKVCSASKRDMVMAARQRTDDAQALMNFYDVTLAHYLLQPDMRHGMRELIQTYLGTTLDYEAAIPQKKGKGSKAAAVPPHTEVFPRACRLAEATLALRRPLEKLLQEEKLDVLLRDIELPLVRVLAGMELAGVRIDVEALRQAAREMESRMSEIEKEVWELAGEQFNVGSPSQVGEILFSKMGLDPKAKKTKTGQYSTSEDVLEKVAHKSPIVGKILEYRQVKKLLNTYLTVLPESINPVTGHVHTNYNQTVTATGRISSSAPNLQNIPVRDDIGREIRRAFIADPGHLFLSADYSQIELRLVADFAGEEVMVDAFATGKDIHAITAAKIYHKTPETVSADERRNAKTANFGILYGISAFGLSSRLEIPRAEAKDLIDNYFKTFPVIHKYMSDSVEEAREHHYAITRFGRKRRLPDINSRNPTVRGVAERNAINAPVQGSAADIMKLAMIRIDEEMRSRSLKSKMIMQVHDELNFDVVPEELEVMKELVKRQMEGAWDGRVILTASVGVADNWLDAH